MKRNSGKRWAIAAVLVMCAADGAGIYSAHLRLQRSVDGGASDNSYADASAYTNASAIKDAWHGSGRNPALDAQRAYASATPYAPAAGATVAPVIPAPSLVSQRLAQAAVAIPAFKPRTDPFLTAPRLAEAAPAERVELATEVHAARHREALHHAVLHHAAARLAQRDAAPPTSQSFAAAFGGGSTDSFALPEPTFGKTAEFGNADSDVAQPILAVPSSEAPHVDMGDSATIGTSTQPSAAAADAELPAAAQPAPSSN